MLSASNSTTSLSLGAILLIVLPATIALIGVLVSSIVSSLTTHRAEDRRAKNVVSAQVLEAGRQAELDALYSVAEFVAKIKRFNGAMYGNTGEGEDDARSADAFSQFVEAFDGFDSLTRAAMTVQTLGAKQVSQQIESIRSETLEYVMSLKGPVFKGQYAKDFEDRILRMLDELVETVRIDFGTDAARSTRPSL